MSVDIVNHLLNVMKLLSKLYGYVNINFYIACMHIHVAMKSNGFQLWIKDCTEAMHVFDHSYSGEITIL